MNRKCVSLVLPALLLLGVGCGSNGTITGTVTYKSTPIPVGTIQFAPDNGAPMVTVPIVDGKYTVEKVPPGPAKVGVTSTYSDPSQMTPMQRMAKAGKGLPPDALEHLQAGGPPKKGIKIPDSYADPEKSNLTYTVKGGSQTHDFDLK